MEPNKTQNIDLIKHKASAKDFFLNLGAIVALYTVVFNLVNLLFTVIEKAYPQINANNYYPSTYSISFPVATLIIFFPIFLLLMWLMSKGYSVDPEKKNLNVKKWLTYITLFIAGLGLAGDLVYVLYYFIDGQEMTTGFVSKAFAVLVVAGLVFSYYISDVRDKLGKKAQMIWLLVSSFIILASIVVGFMVLGSPHTQQLVKYDEQKVVSLQNIDSGIKYFWQTNSKLPDSLNSITGCDVQSSLSNGLCVDQQTNKSFEYNKINDKEYEICAEFNKEAIYPAQAYISYTYYGGVWNHPAGHYCFKQTINVNIQNPPKAIPLN
jgi:Domain of unknown function (DUF5671)